MIVLSMGDTYNSIIILEFISLFSLLGAISVEFGPVFTYINLSLPFRTRLSSFIALG